MIECGHGVKAFANTMTLCSSFLPTMIWGDVKWQKSLSAAEFPIELNTAEFPGKQQRSCLREAPTSEEGLHILYYI